MTFQEKLTIVSRHNNSLLCVGLDPEIEKMPAHFKSTEDPIFEFNKAVITATYDLVCTYKPNIAFYEAYGIEGLQSLKRTIEYLQDMYPDIPVLLDAKRGDIGNTAKMYAKAVFDFWQADAVTVNGQLGYDAVSPFLEYKNKLTIVLIKTSNPDSKRLSDMLVDGKPYFVRFAEEVKKWDQPNLGLFVGATYPEDLKIIRQMFPDKVILTAGIGAQNATTEETIKAGVDTQGNNLICNNSRGIMYAGTDEDYSEKVREAAIAMKDTINTHRQK